MKKVFYTATALGVCLFLSSFSVVNNDNPTFNEINENDSALAAELGSFVEAQQSHYAGDKTEWHKRRKTWTDFAQAGEEETSTMQGIINRN